MSAEYEEHHDQIHEGDTPEELVEHGEEAEAEAMARAAEEKQKKDKKMKVFLFGGLGVIAVVYFGYKIVSGPVAPAKAPMNSMLSGPANPAMGNPPAPAVGVSAVPAMGAAPVAVAPVVAVPVVAVPAVGAVPAPGGVADPAAQAAAISLPAATPAMPGAAAPVAVDPMAANPAVPAVGASAASVSASAAPIAAADAKPSEGLARGLDELTKKIDDLKAMFSKFDEMNIGDRLAKLEARVGALEGGKPSAKPAMKSSEGSAPVKRHVVRSRAPAANKVVPLGQGEDLLFARVVEPRASMDSGNVVTRVSAPETKSPRAFALHAVIPGRIWVKGQDGNSQNFENGETLPDGSKILKIDPDRGEVVTSKGVLKFEAR